MDRLASHASVPALRVARRGFTLIEILIVLAVLVAVAAMSAPAIFGVWENQRLRDAGDLVRADWGRARVRAMKTGRIHVFQYSLNAGDYIVEPWYSESDDEQSIDDDSSASEQASSQSASAPPTNIPGGDFLGSGGGAPGVRRILPKDIVFHSGRTSLDTRGLSVAQSMESQGASSGGESEPVMFYPDGTASTAELVLRNSRDRYLVLSMRGLTGVVRAGKPVTEDQLPQ